MANFRQIGEDELRKPQAYASLAMLRISRDELANLGIELIEPVDDGTWSEAGPIEVALVETASGEQPLLIWHSGVEGNPDGYSPLELRAPISTTDPAAFANAVLDSIGFPRDRCEWLVESRYWPPFPGAKS